MAVVQEQFEQATQQPQQQQPQLQPKKANWWKRGILIAAGGFVLTIGGCAALVGAIAVGGSSSDTPEPQAKNYTVGQKAQTVDMTWLVTGAYQTQELEDVYGLDDPKRGNFVVVDFKFTNGADEAVTLDPTMHMELKDCTGAYVLARRRDVRLHPRPEGHLP